MKNYKVEIRIHKSEWMIMLNRSVLEKLRDKYVNDFYSDEHGKWCKQNSTNVYSPFIHNVEYGKQQISKVELIVTIIFTEQQYLTYMLKYGPSRIHYSEEVSADFV